MRIRRRRNREGPGEELVSAFLNLNAVLHRQVFEDLTESTGPANGGADRCFDFPDSEEELLGVLGEESGTGLKVFGLTMASGFDCHCGADGIAIAFLSAQTECDGVANIFHRIVQDA